MNENGFSACDMTTAAADGFRKGYRRAKNVTTAAAVVLALLLAALTYYVGFRVGQQYGAAQEDSRLYKLTDRELCYRLGRVL